MQSVDETRQRGKEERQIEYGPARDASSIRTSKNRSCRGQASLGYSSGGIVCEK